MYHCCAQFYSLIFFCGFNHHTGPAPVIIRDCEEALVVAGHQDFPDEPDSRFLFIEAPPSFDNMSVAGQKEEVDDSLPEMEILGGMMTETQNDLEKIHEKLADY